MTRERQAWIEWLRVISMVWIILFHFSDHGTINMAREPLSINWLGMAFFRIGGGVGNSIFALISGYLLCDKKFRVSRLIKLWFEIEFYSIVCFFIAMATNTYEGAGAAEIMRNFIPIVGIRYWYASVYFFIYLLHPFMNRIICNLSYKRFVVLITIIFFFCSFVPTAFGVETFTSGGCVEIFILLYLIGAFLRKYPVFENGSLRYWLCFFILITVMGLSEVILKIVGGEINRVGWIGNVLKAIASNDFSYFVWPMERTPVILAGILLFLAVKNSRFTMPQRLMKLVQSTFGVYLIHIGTLAGLIFKEIFDIQHVYNHRFFIVIVIVYALIIYVACLVLDQIRIHFLEIPIMNILYRKLSFEQ